MTFLFDVSPTDNDGKKAHRKRAAEAVAETPEPVFVHTPTAHGGGVQPILGKIDNTYHCGDGACGSHCHDILREERGEWYVACAFCGTSQWVPAIVIKKEKPKEGVFRLHGGRFPGMTLDEVSVLDDGLNCIKWWATGKKIEKDVQAAARAWLEVNKEKHLDKTLGTR